MPVFDGLSLIKPGARALADFPPQISEAEGKLAADNFQAEIAVPLLQSGSQLLRFLLQYIRK
jgi:hypothetical protein